MISTPNVIPFFIHIPKNGGMTIRKSALIRVQVADSRTHKSEEYTKKLVNKMQSLGDHHGIEHARWQDINPYLWKGHYRPFAIIRNPWDRVVSRYFFAKKVIEVEKKVPSSYADVRSFEHFLEERHKWGNEPFMWHRAVRGWYPAFEHVVDPTTGKIAKNIDIMRFEEYNFDFQRYFRVHQSPKPRNITALNKQHYTKIYTNETIQIVADWYKKDIETWGYDFDRGPTKNFWYHSYIKGTK
jgi:hypothetical protein